MFDLSGLSNYIIYDLREANTRTQKAEFVSYPIYVNAKSQTSPRRGSRQIPYTLSASFQNSKVPRGCTLTEASDQRILRIRKILRMSLYSS
jgi:hypothetical protein